MSTETVAAAGRSRIEWARRDMPVMRALAGQLNGLEGLRVGVGLVLEPKTANLALTLSQAGAEVVVYCSAHSGDAETAEALRSHGLVVHCDPEHPERDEELADAFLSSGLDILLDDGAWLTRRMHSHHPEALEKLMGATEETTSGVRPLTQMAAAGELKVPVVAVNNALTKHLFDNVYGTGQSCVMALLDITNLQLAGRQVVVVGYGYVGKGVARHAAAMGARVTVTEIDPVKALQAHHDGHRVRTLAEAAPEAEVVFTCTGLRGAVPAHHLENFPDGVILCVPGGGPYELPMDELRATGTEQVVRAHVKQYTLGERRVLVITDGYDLNITGGEGNPIEVMDLSLSLQALAAEMVATMASSEPGLVPLPREAEDRVARLRLAAEGASCEPITSEITAAIHAW